MLRRIWTIPHQISQEIKIDGDDTFVKSIRRSVVVQSSVYSQWSHISITVSNMSIPKMIQTKKEEPNSFVHVARNFNLMTVQC